MELINKEELIKAIDVFIDNDFMEGGGEEVLKNLIANFPIAESRPKGKWVRKEYYFDEWVDECSVCGEAYSMIDGTATENGYNYCPNCGAQMEGE